MKGLHGMYRLNKMDIVTDEVVRRRVGVSEKMTERMDRKVFKWFGHVERMKEEFLTKRVFP